MARNITINPVTRIEGHASVELNLDDTNTIQTACFKVMDFRGFETFLQGMKVEMMPTITSRICGTCPVTHHLAAVRAVDKIFDTTIPEAARILRNILNLGGIIHSHAIHLFALAGPDLLLGINAPLEKRNLLGVAEKYPDLAKKAILLKSHGHRICEIVGGRGTHPVTMVAGGMAKPLSREQVEKLQSTVQEAAALGSELYPQIKEVLLQQMPLMKSLPIESAYLGTVSNGALELYDGPMRMRSTTGEFQDFSEEEWVSRLTETTNRDTYGKSTYYTVDGQSVMYRVGPLARLNCADSIDTPLAQQELAHFREVAGFPCHQTVMYHYARLIELLYALEKVATLVAAPEIASDEVRAPLGSPRNGVAHVEAPRGVLIHDYQVDENALVTKANLLVATQQNIDAINETIKLSAQQYIDQPEEELLNAIEFGIRCYDPCLSCATHRIGAMKMDVTIRHRGALIRQVRRM